MMRAPLLDLDRTLDNGQVFRWRKSSDTWTGVLGNKVVKLRQRGDELDVDGDISEAALASYFRLDDDLETIYADIAKDECMTELVRRFRGMRLIRQPIWECCASYILATFSNVPRIKKMIENVCRTYGRPLSDGLYSFPTPEELAESDCDISQCRLGFRDQRLLMFAQAVHSGDFDLEHLKELDYGSSVKYLLTVHGIGRKVADCIALFSLDHLEAVPVDVRISRALRDIYGASGNYDKVSGFAQQYFGRYAGYAQEYLYLAEERTMKKELGTMCRVTQGTRTREA